jgi:polyferredoxin
MLRYLGIEDFFTLHTGSMFFWVFLIIVIISIFVYRPFCRLACPYGALLSLAAIKGKFKLRRNENCINCKKCSEVCPTNEAGWTNLKQECYMCNRCQKACPG